MHSNRTEYLNGKYMHCSQWSTCILTKMFFNQDRRYHIFIITFSHPSHTHIGNTFFIVHVLVDGDLNKPWTADNFYLFFIFISIFFYSFCTSLHIYCTYIQFIEGEGTKGKLTTGCFWAGPKQYRGKKSEEKIQKLLQTSFSFLDHPWPCPETKHNTLFFS